MKIFSIKNSKNDNKFKFANNIRKKNKFLSKFKFN